MREALGDYFDQLGVQWTYEPIECDYWPDAYRWTPLDEPGHPS